GGGVLLGSPSSAQEDEEMQRELFRKVARATEQGIPSWVPVGVVAADGTETRAYAAVYPLTSTSSSFSPLTPARDVGGKAASGS
ncbi:unnamed protein product, partial [Ectocarpus sp. 12 AP-2014]